jgi:hypothetical protein
MGKVTLEVLFVVATLCFTNGVANAGGKTYWQENGVCVCESTFAGGMHPIDVVSDDCGGAIVVWADNRHEVAGDGICAQRIRGDGNVLWDTDGVEIMIPTPRPPCLFPDIHSVTDGQSGAVIAWECNGEGIYASRVDSNGIITWETCIREPFADEDSTTESPYIAVAPNGETVIVWIETAGGLGNIYAQRLDSTGNKKWDDRGVPICTLYSASYPYSRCVAVAVTEDNAAGVFWTDYRKWNHDIYVQKVDSFGTPVWIPNGIPVCDTVEAQSIGQILSMDGDLLLTWSDQRSGEWSVYAQRVDSAGRMTWVANGLLLCTLSGRQMASRKGGALSFPVPWNRAIVAWQDGRDGNHDIYAQQLDLDGEFLWQANGVFVCTAAPGAEESICFSIDSDERGGVVIAWSDYRDGDWDGYAQRIDSSGTLRWGDAGLPTCTTPDYQWWGHVVIADGEGGAFVAWGDSRFPGPRAGVYVQRVGDDTAGVEEGLKARITGAELQAYPNPFVGHTRVVGRKSDVSLRVYDIMGRLVENSDEGVVGRRLPTGAYFVEAGGYEPVRVTKIGGVP